MKKLMGISVIAMLAVAAGFSAHAAPVAGEPSAKDAQTEASAVTATAEPEFALVEANSATDGNAASAGYVKGAYNAAIKAINKVNAKTTVNAGNGLAKDGNTMTVDLTSTGGLQLDGSTDGSKTVGIKAGDGIKTDANGVAVDLTTNSGLEISSNKLQVKAGNGTQIEQTNGTLEVKGGDGITVGANGVAVDLTANKGLIIDGTSKKLEIDYDNSTIDVDSTNHKLEVKDGGITTAKIANSNVTADKLATDSVTNAKIEDGAVTVAKIASTDIAAGTGTYADSTDLANQGYVDQQIAGLNIGDYATKNGVNNTITNATYQTTLGTFSVTDGTVDGSASFAIMNDWSNPNTPAATPATVTLSGMQLQSTAITNGTATTTATAADYEAANVVHQEP